jgi:hypothetical protein
MCVYGFKPSGALVELNLRTSGKRRWKKMNAKLDDVLKTVTAQSAVVIAKKALLHLSIIQSNLAKNDLDNANKAVSKALLDTVDILQHNEKDYIAGVKAMFGDSKEYNDTLAIVEKDTRELKAMEKFIQNPGQDTKVDLLKTIEA